MKPFKPRVRHVLGEVGGRATMTSNCLNMWLDYKKRSLKTILNQHSLLDKIYPHSLLTFTIKLSTAFHEEIKNFVITWCNGGAIETTTNTMYNDIEAIEEIFETEDQDYTTWYTELLANKHYYEDIDRLITNYMIHIRTLHELGILDP
jgi:hypothetical protein